MRFVAFIAASLMLAGCGATAEKVASPPSPSYAAPAAQPAGSAEPSEPEQPDVAAIGEWAKAEDGVRFRVSKLTRGRVSQYASGGHPGDPAVIVTVQVRNGSDHRLDLSLISVTARLGDDGREAEEVYQDSFMGSPSGSLSRGRTSTSRYMFAANKAGELKKVSLDVSPGFDYDSFTFEGSA
jgi:hypothetical protein